MKAIARPTAEPAAAPALFEQPPSPGSAGYSPDFAGERLPRPSFLGSVGGEILKLRRQGMIWAMLGLAVFLFAMVAGALTTADNVRQTLEKAPSTFVFNMYDVYLTMFDVGSGIFLLIVSARLVGMEYSGGTIRVLLARGAGRVRLLLAKLTALAIVALVLIAGFLGLAGAAMYATVVHWEGSFDKISSLPGTAWHDLGLNIVVALASMAAAILIGTAAAVIGRSLAFGIGAALFLYPADNLLTAVMPIFKALTGTDIWLNISAYLLGPNLDVLPVVMQTDHQARAAFAVPLIKVDVTHAWLVVGAWALVLAVVAFGLSWRRDVLQ